MPRFFKKVKNAPRRRLQPKAAVALAPTAIKLARAGLGYAKSGMRVYKDAKTFYNSFPKRKSASKPRYTRGSAIADIQSDNITTVKSTVIGKQRPLSFDERVSRVERPPILFKRNYQFNAEGISGRKCWFSFEFNKMDTNDLQTDLTTYRDQQFTDTASSDTLVAANNAGDAAKFYVDYLSEKLHMVNSSSNSIIGKIHLFAHRRDNSNVYNGTVPITPINLMMFYSTHHLPLAITANEATVGNGWKFDTATSGLNFNAHYNMPGSSINATGVTAQTDFELSPSSRHVSDGINFWFKNVDTYDFNLKPGQQINKSYIFNDLQDIMREEQASYTHLANISYSCVIEFRGGIVGTTGASTTDVSTGISQLSIMRESKRVLGIRNKLKSKVYLITPAPTIITQANNQMINPDTGTQLTGAQLD